MMPGTKSRYIQICAIFILIFCCLEMQAQESDSTMSDSMDLDKGPWLRSMQLGLTLLPAYGRQSAEEHPVLNASIDVDLYFTKRYGLRTGIRYLYTDITYYPVFWVSNRLYTIGYADGHRHKVGIPFKFNYNSLKKIGIYTEAGVVVYFLKYSEAREQYPHIDYIKDVESRGLDLTWDFEAAFGLHWMLRDSFRMKLGCSAAISQVYDQESLQYFVGLQAGLSYVLF